MALVLLALQFFQCFEKRLRIVAGSILIFDPEQISYELDENLSKTVNFDCFEPLVAAAKKSGVRRFVYCSSSSVYGVSE